MLEWGRQDKTKLMAIYKYLHFCWNGGDKRTLMATSIYIYVEMGETS